MFTKLKGIDVSSCQFKRLEVDYAQLRGLIVNSEQAALLGQLYLGLKLTD